MAEPIPAPRPKPRAFVCRSFMYYPRTGKRVEVDEPTLLEETTDRRLRPVVRKIAGALPEAAPPEPEGAA